MKVCWEEGSTQIDQCGKSEKKLKILSAERASSQALDS